MFTALALVWISLNYFEKIDLRQFVDNLASDLFFFGSRNVTARFSLAEIKVASVLEPVGQCRSGNRISVCVSMSSDSFRMFDRFNRSDDSDSESLP